MPSTPIDVRGAATVFAVRVVAAPAGLDWPAGAYLRWERRVDQYVPCEVHKAAFGDSAWAAEVVEWLTALEPAARLEIVPFVEKPAIGSVPRC